MKKLVAFAAVIAAVSFASCGNKSAENTEVAETETEATVEEVVAPAEQATTEETAVAEGDSTAVEAPAAELKLLLLNNHSAISDEDSLYACNIQTFFVFKLM